MAKYQVLRHLLRVGVNNSIYTREGAVFLDVQRRGKDYYLWSLGQVDAPMVEYIVFSAYSQPDTEEQIELNEGDEYLGTVLRIDSCEVHWFLRR